MNTVGEGLDPPLRFIIRIFRNPPQTLSAYFSKAMTLLAEGKLSVGQIAVQCGFASEEYFYAFFKRATGQTPLQYRRNAH